MDLKLGVEEWMFQSTLPRGERHVESAVLYASGRSFNPRSHEGSDKLLLPILKRLTGFNPRLK